MYNGIYYIEMMVGMSRREQHRNLVRNEKLKLIIHCYLDGIRAFDIY